jgi:hypothetical protein
MQLMPEEDGRSLTDGTLLAHSGTQRDWMNVEHEFILQPPSLIASGTWTIAKDPVHAPLDPFQVLLSFVPTTGPPFFPVTVTYTEGASIVVPFRRVPMMRPSPVDFALDWSDLDGRRLPDGDEITLTTRPRERAGALVELETGSQVDWWKAIHLLDIVGNRDALLVKTDGAGQSRAGPAMGVPVGLAPPERARLRNLTVVLHKPKFLGTDTPIYRLNLSSAPFLAVPTTFHFLWRRQ